MMLTDAQARFFNQQLEHVISKMYEVQYGDLTYRTIFPVAFDTPAGTQTIVRQHLDHRGKAQWISNHATDLPRADVSGGETIYPVKECASSFGYTMAEIRRGSLTGVNLNQERANAARRKIEEEMNAATFSGVADINLPGLFTNASIPTDVVANGALGTPQWSTKTPDEILKDVSTLWTNMDNATQQKETPNKLGLPPPQWNSIFTTPRSSTSDTTIATWLVANTPWLSSTDDIVKVRELATSGAGSSAEVLIYKYDPDKLVVEIPMDVTIHEPQLRGLEYLVPVTAEFASLHVMYPLSLRFGGAI